MATRTIVRLSDQSAGFITNASASATYQAKVANVSNEEIGYLDGVTSGIQSQINSKLSASSASTTYAPIVPTVPTSFRNAFTNGNFSIDQRNNSAAQTITSGSPLSYTADRWFAYSIGSNISGQRIPITQFLTRYVYKFTGLSPNHITTYFGQRIESQNSFHLAGKTATLSVDLAKSHGGSIGWYAYYANTKDSFGSISSPTKTYFANGGWDNIGQNFSRYTTNISIPAEAVNGIEIYFVFSYLSNLQEVFFRDVQLEVGSVATPFENRPIGLELALCQRYFVRLYDPSGTGVSNGGTANGATRVTVGLPVEMRVVPTSLTANGTFSFWDGTNAPTGTLSSTSYFFPSKTSIEVEFNLSSAITAGKAVKMYTSNSTSKWLDINAEL